MSTKQLAYTDLVGTAGTGAAAAGSACGQFTIVRVKPGDAASSLIWQKVNAKLNGTTLSCGSGMPFGGTALTQAQVDQIAAWIDAGALND